jgi:hypothetical protein
MAEALPNIEKAKRDRPRTDATPIMVRLQPDQLAALDAWIDGQKLNPSRPEAIRALLRAVLG